MQPGHYPLGVLKEIFDAVTLTSSYDDNESDSYENKAIGITDKAVLYIEYTTGDGEINNELYLKVRVSTTGEADTWHSATVQSVSGGTVSVAEAEYKFIGAAAATTYRISIPLELHDKYVQFLAKEAGVVTNAGVVSMTLSLTGN